jgi:hypothetical protein
MPATAIVKHGQATAKGQLLPRPIASLPICKSAEAPCNALNAPDSSTATIHHLELSWY